MKNIYETPVLNVECFISENILTASGVGNTGADQGANALTQQGYSADKVNVGGLNWSGTQVVL